MFLPSLNDQSSPEQFTRLARLAANHGFVCSVNPAQLQQLNCLPSYALRWVLKGHLSVQLDTRRWQIDRGQALVTNPGQSFEVTHNSATDTEVLVLSLPPSLMQQCYQAIRASSRKLLQDETVLAKWPVSFADPTPALDDHITSVLYAIFQALELGVQDTRWLEQHLSILAERLLVREYRSQLRRQGDGRSAALAARLVRVREMIDEQFAEPLSVERMAREAAVSLHHFLRCFKRAFGATPHQYLVERRLEMARHLLETSNLPVGEIGRQVGFESANGFHGAFKRRFSCSPATLRRPLAPVTVEQPVAAKRKDTDESHPLM